MYREHTWSSARRATWRKAYIAVTKAMGTRAPSLSPSRSGSLMQWDAGCTVTDARVPCPRAMTRSPTWRFFTPSPTRRMTPTAWRPNPPKVVAGGELYRSDGQGYILFGNGIISNTAIEGWQ